MKMKTWVKATTLLGLLTWAAMPARAGKFVDTFVGASSGAYFVGYDGGSTAPAKGKTDRVFTSSGAAVIQSTSATSGHKPLRVLNAAGTEILSLTQGGVLTATTLTGNAATATALAANGANCSAGNYPLGVDASGAVESCTSAGIGDLVSTSSPSPSGYWTFTSTVANPGGREIRFSSMSLTGAVTTTGTGFVCPAGSSITFTSAGNFVNVRARASGQCSGNGCLSRMAVLKDGSFISPTTSAGGDAVNRGVSADSTGISDLTLNKFVAVTRGLSTNFCMAGAGTGTSTWECDDATCYLEVSDP